MSQVGTVAIALALLTVPNRDTTPCARRPRSGNEMCSGPDSQAIFVCEGCRPAVFCGRPLFIQAGSGRDETSWRTLVSRLACETFGPLRGGRLSL
ncbi:hypothetical protein PR001_g5170 [Phytophthora rubi]|uniref:Uncharacterized protein n=1 Tax=Phytophthora rubi TaxID=129364 RepID=A0A6A3KQ37_9STRA|nr:hypothetical protein PR002_g15652 [Phytophthora rubi]KAE9044920.1 hypothetical protein PR001_g5170 [Phytophthora rubi]